MPKAVFAIGIAVSGPIAMSCFSLLSCLHHSNVPLDPWMRCSDGPAWAVYMQHCVAILSMDIVGFLSGFDLF